MSVFSRVFIACRSVWHWPVSLSNASNHSSSYSCIYISPSFVGRYISLSSVASVWSIPLLMNISNIIKYTFQTKLNVYQYSQSASLRFIWHKTLFFTTSLNNMSLQTTLYFIDWTHLVDLLLSYFNIPTTNAVGDKKMHDKTFTVPLVNLHVHL